MSDMVDKKKAAAESELKFLRGERKSLLRHLASWEEQGHTTVTLTFLHRHLAKKQNKPSK